MTYACFVMAPRVVEGRGFFIALLGEDRIEIACVARTLCGSLPRTRQVFTGTIGSHCEGPCEWHLCAYYEDDEPTTGKRMLLSDIPFRIKSA